MRSSRLAAAVVVLLSVTARADTPPSRSWLSGLGVAVAGLGVGAVVFGVSQQLVAADSRARVLAYYPTVDGKEQKPTQSEAGAVRILQDRLQSAGTFAVVGFIAGGVLIAGGILALVLDRPAPVQAWFAPSGSGGGVIGLVGDF
jgi:hypothetical protein